MSDKPGVMIYFDLMDAIKYLSDEETGQLMRSILEYGKSKTIPVFDRPLNLVWSLVQSRLDTDDQRYYQVAQKRKYAIYVRWAKHHGHEPMPYDDWLCSIDRCDDTDISALPL